jgi:hypothetical protein
MDVVEAHEERVRRMEEMRDSLPRDEAITSITIMLREEYSKLETLLKELREKYLAMDRDSSASQNDVADLRLEAVEAYAPVYFIEDFLTGQFGADLSGIAPEYAGNYQASAVRDSTTTLNFVSLKENAMRTLGAHCSVIGEFVILERRLYDNTYLAGVMKTTDPMIVTPDDSNGTEEHEDDRQYFLEYDFPTVVFDEDITGTMSMPLNEDEAK